MPRQKRTSRTLEKAELRAIGLKAIDPKLKFDEIYTVSYLTNMIDELQAKLDAYNMALTIIDSSQTEITELEKKLGEASEKMLLGVAFKYGKDSREYEMAGGVRKSDRIRRSANSRIKASADSQLTDSK